MTVQIQTPHLETPQMTLVPDSNVVRAFKFKCSYRWCLERPPSHNTHPAVAVKPVYAYHIRHNNKPSRISICVMYEHQTQSARAQLHIYMDHIPAMVEVVVVVEVEVEVGG